MGLKSIQNTEALCTSFENFLKEKDISPEDYQKAIKIKENFAQILKRRGAELTEKDIKNIKELPQLALKKYPIKPEDIHQQDEIIHSSIIMGGIAILYRKFRGATLTHEEESELERGIDTIFKMIEKNKTL